MNENTIMRSENMQRAPVLHRLSAHLVAAGILVVAAPVLAQTDSSGDMLVTATKTATPASKTPIALSVADGEALKTAGITDARGLTELVPNLQIGQESGKLQIAIRGVTSLDMTEKGDPSAAFHVDGAYIGRPEAQGAAFFDIDRIEVLRGPQGTLYGRNATAGAINVISNKPTNTFGGKVGLELGDFGTVRSDLVLNVPVNDRLSLRAAVNTNRHNSYYNPGPNVNIPLESQNDRAARLHALLKISPDTSLLLTAEHALITGGGTSPVLMTNFFTGAMTDTLPFSPPGSGNNILNPVYVDKGSSAQRTITSPFVGTNAHRHNENNALRGEFKTKLSGMELTYQGSYMRNHVDELGNGIYFGFPLTAKNSGGSSQSSHELRLNSAGAGPLKWVAGIYAFNESINRDSAFNTFITAPFGSFTVDVPYQPRVTNKSTAAFGQVTYSLTPATRVVFGLRQTRDEKTGSDPLGGVAATPPATSSEGAYSAAVKFNNTSWRLGMDHDLSKDVMLYASAATGYKAGGFNDNKNAGSYKPEHLTALEGGIKGRFLDNALQLSANLFHYDYKDLQLTSIICRTADPSSCGSVTSNAANASVDGTELEGRLRVGKQGMLRASLALTKAQFRDYQPNAATDWSGQRLDRAPRSVVGLGYTHRFPLASGAEIAATFNTRISSSYTISDPAPGIRYTQPSYHKSDLIVGYTDPSGALNVQAFVKNIENKITIESRVPSSFYVGDPRTLGVRASYNF